MIRYIIMKSGLYDLQEQKLLLWTPDTYALANTSEAELLKI